MKASQAINIVSGLPRSGTSLMMSMLEAGGLELVQDGIRVADEDNPKGYYELERVKKLKEDKAWLPGAKGKVVKAISQLLYEFPTDGSFRYNVIFMRRNIDEILASQTKMLKRRGTHDPSVSDEEIRRMFLIHLDHVTTYLRQHPCFETLYVNYNLLMQDAAEKVRALGEFLGGELNAAAMTDVIDASLYRNRS